MAKVQSHQSLKNTLSERLKIYKIASVTKRHVTLKRIACVTKRHVTARHITQLSGVTCHMCDCHPWHRAAASHQLFARSSHRIKTNTSYTTLHEQDRSNTELSSEICAFRTVQNTFTRRDSYGLLMLTFELEK